MRKTIAEHRFANDVRIRVSFVSGMKDVPKVDCLLLELTSVKRSGKLKTRGFYMRCDEALLIAEKLVRGVHDVAVAYKISRPKGKVAR